MRSPVIYLNELSCLFEGLSPNIIRRHVEISISAIRSAVHIRPEILLRLHRPLSEITLGEEHLTFGAVLPRQNDMFRLLKRLLDKAPCGPVSALDQEIRYATQIPVGMSWADHDKSFVLSFGHAAAWSNSSIQTVRHTLDATGELITSAVSIRNIAVTDHAEFWRANLEEYGKDIASSSLLYRGHQFVIRMHFNDHDPPHFHVYRHADDTNELLAKIRIDNGDLLEGYLSSAMQTQIESLRAQNRDLLLDGWNRCRRGEHPLSIMVD